MNECERRNISNQKIEVRKNIKFNKLFHLKYNKMYLAKMFTKKYFFI